MHCPDPRVAIKSLSSSPARLLLHLMSDVRPTGRLRLPAVTTLVKNPHRQVLGRVKMVGRSIFVLYRELAVHTLHDATLHPNALHVIKDLQANGKEVSGDNDPWVGLTPV